MTTATDVPAIRAALHALSLMADEGLTTRQAARRAAVRLLPPTTQALHALGMERVTIPNAFTERVVDHIEDIVATRNARRALAQRAAALSPDYQLASQESRHSLLRSRTAHRLLKLVGPHRCNMVLNRSGWGASWTREEMETWDAYSKGWHRQYGPKKEIVSSLYLDLPAFRRACQHDNGLVGTPLKGNLILCARPLPLVGPPTYEVVQLRHGKGKNAQILTTSLQLRGTRRVAVSSQEDDFDAP